MSYCISYMINTVILFHALTRRVLWKTPIVKMIMSFFICIGKWKMSHCIFSYSVKVWRMIHQHSTGMNQRNREELYQLCMIKLAEAIDSYQMDKQSSFATYYMKIVKHVILDYVKKQARYQSHIDEFTMLYGFEVCDESGHYLREGNEAFPHAKKELQNEQLRQLLSESKVILKEREYQILAMRMQGYTYKEIAEKMHLSRNTIDYMVRKLRKQKDGID